VAEFSAFFPSRWHNTIIQLLASCGVVGLLAYCYHRYQTIRLFVKKRTTVNVYIGIYIVTLLGMSLLDCHFFNVGPVLFYSIALAVMEYGKSMDKV
jgi:O-antigen ligase